MSIVQNVEEWAITKVVTRGGVVAVAYLIGLVAAHHGFLETWGIHVDTVTLSAKLTAILTGAAALAFLHTAAEWVLAHLPKKVQPKI